VSLCNRVREDENFKRLSEKIIAVAAMPEGQERIEAECQCVSSCLESDGSGYKRFDKEMLLRLAASKEASVFFSFHVAPDQEYRMINNPLCGFLPVWSRREVDLIEKLLHNRPQVLFAPYQTRFSKIPQSYLDIAFNSCWFHEKIVGRFLELDERIQHHRNISVEIRDLFHSWLKARTELGSPLIASRKVNEGDD
jgi:hypothetical protein